MSVMRLFTEECADSFAEKKIICYEYSAKCISEFRDEFPMLFSNILYVVDDYVRRIDELNVPHIRWKDCQNIDWSNTQLLIMSDYYAQAYEKITKSDCALPEVIYYFLTKDAERELFFLHKFSNKEICKKIIFRSGPHESQYVRGTDFCDNARALFEYMLSRNMNKEYELIWFVKNPREFAEWERRYENVKFLSFDKKTNEYYEALFTAKYVIMTDAYGFARNCRPEQIRIQLWHGCGFKTRTNFVPCEKRYEYNIVISDLYKKIHADIYGLRDDQVVVTGYPKADWLNKPISREKLGQLGIPMANKYIFWLPTFRKAKKEFSELNEKGFGGDTGLPVVENFEDFASINEILQRENAVLVVKLHPFQDDKQISVDRLSNVVLLKNDDLVREDLQINQVLAWADALISDYSSVAVEYLLLDRPIGFCLDDVEEYENSRGFVFDNVRDYLPGAELYSFSDFWGFIDDVLAEKDTTYEKRHSITKKMYKYCDFNSSKRVMEWMLKLDCSKRNDL